MIVKKFSIIALLVALLSISGGECKRRGGLGSFLGGVASGVLLHHIAKPKPKPQTTYLYQSYAQPMYLQPPVGQQVPMAPITPHGTPMNYPINTINGQGPTGYQPPMLQNQPAYPGQQPIVVVGKSGHKSGASRSISGLILHPCFYGLNGMLTYFFGKGFRLVL